MGGKLLKEVEMSTGFYHVHRRLCSIGLPRMGYVHQVVFRFHNQIRVHLPHDGGSHISAGPCEGRLIHFRMCDAKGRMNHVVGLSKVLVESQCDIRASRPYMRDYDNLCYEVSMGTWITGGKDRSATLCLPFSEIFINQR